MTSVTRSSFNIKWEKLPDDFILPDDPVDNIHQPAIAAALTDSLEVIVMEFLSHTNGQEYSNKPTYPPGKWFFYEKILKVPHYIIFEPYSGLIEHYQLHESGGYEI